MKATREDTIGYNLKKDTALDVEVMWKRLVCHLFYVVVHVGVSLRRKINWRRKKTEQCLLGGLVRYFLWKFYMYISRVGKFARVCLHAKQYICWIGKAIKMVVPVKGEIWYAKLDNAQLMNAPKVLEMYV